MSGSTDSRPELNRLMVDAKRRKFDVVLIWKLDRFGRSLRHLVNALAEFESLNTAFVSLSDNLDLSTASGRLRFGDGPWVTVWTVSQQKLALVIGAPEFLGTLA